MRRLTELDAELGTRFATDGAQRIDRSRKQRILIALWRIDGKNHAAIRQAERPEADPNIERHAVRFRPQLERWRRKAEVARTRHRFQLTVNSWPQDDRA